MRSAPALPSPLRLRGWARHVAAVATSAALTVAATPLRDLLAPANIVMLYLLATMAVAIAWGRGPAALASVCNVLAFDFFFVPPRWSFAFGDVQYLITFGVMLAVGIVTGQLTGGLRQQARVAAGSERRAHSLFELARDLASALQAEQVAERGAEAVRRQFGGDARVLPTNDPDPVLPASDEGWLVLPLAAPARVRGVLTLRPASPESLREPEERQHLETMARQIAIALERVHYVDVAQRTSVEIASERLRSALLSAISHDIRTPLTALIGLAESLRASRPALAPAQAETAEAIAQQARSLAQLAHNLLDMARLQAGPAQLRLDWESLEEVVGTALRHVVPAPAAGTLRVQLPRALPLVQFDAVLLERVLVNLVENALKYGAAPIEIGAEAEPQSLRVWVRDHGPGLPSAWQGREQELFEKFIRGDPESATPGAGLGLAICKAVVEAHGGRITAGNAADGGACFTFRLPRREPPAAPA